MKTFLKDSYFVKNLIIKDSLVVILYFKKHLFFKNALIKKNPIHTIFACLFIVGSLFCSAQEIKSTTDYNRAIDSLKTLLKTSKTDTNSINILNALSFESKEESPGNSIQFAEEALKLSQDLSFKKGMVKSLTSLGLVYKLSNNIGKALDYNLQSLKIQYEIGNKKEIISSLSRIATLYKTQGNFDKAMEFYINALKISEEISASSESTISRDIQIENKKQEARIIYLIGLLYQKQNNYDVSLKYFLRVLKIYEEINDDNNIADVSVSIGIVFYDKSNRYKSETFVYKGIHKEAMEYIVKARKIYLKNNNKNGLIRADNHLAYISAGQEKFGNALEYAFEGLKIAQEIDNEDMRASLYGTVGDIYFAQGNYKNALEYLNKCFEGAKALNNKEYIRDLYLSFSSIHAKLNNYKKAYEYHTLYAGMKDALLNVQSSKQITEMSAKYDSEKKDKELIKKDAEIAKQQAETQQQQIQRNASIFGFSLVVILAFFIYRGYRNKQKANISITQQKEEVEKSYKNISILSEIEQEITSSLSIEKIIEKVYENVNKLMRADVLCIGIPNKANTTIDFPGFIENGKKYNSSYDLNDNTRFPVLCYNNGQEIFINDLRTEFNKYIPYIPIPIVGDRPESLIYLPLFSKKKVIGVITVESFTKNAYTKIHLDILKNLAVYIAIALENAQLYGNLEEKIEERTVEVLKQKEEVVKSYENTKLLSNIGREITSVLSVEEIIVKVYQNVNKLMDASVFGIGIFNKKENRIEFRGVVENGVELPSHNDELADESRPAVWCFKNQKELFTNDFNHDYTTFFPGKTRPLPKEGDGAASLIYLPLSTSNKHIGVITVQSFRQNAYTEYQLDILRNLAIYTVNALENANLYENMEEEVKYRTQEIIKQKEELEISRNNINVLSEIGQEITSSLSIEKIIEKVYENVNKLMDASVFTIGIYNEEKKRLDFIGTIENGEKIPFQSVEIAGNDRLPSKCFNERKIIFINEYGKEYKKYFPTMPSPIAGRASESIIYIPLIIKDEPIGVITVQSFRKNAFTEYHLNILQSVAIYAAIAIENAQLYENLEGTVQKRTDEVLKQKEEVEKSYKNTKLLSDIGREITAVLSVEEIIKKVYENVNKLMDASAFGIGIFDETEKRINFSGFIEKGEKLPFYYNELADESRLAVWCFKNQKEIFINDLKKEYNNYFPDRIIPVPKAGEQSESIIYLPLSTPKKRIGVITVQSFKENAYSEYQLNMLRNLALYVVNGLENARLYENMEDEVKARTLEIEKQKDELARLSIVASETDNGVLIFGASGEIEWVNSGFTRLQGYGLEELKQRGNTLEKISHNPEIEALVQDCIENKRSSIYQALNITKDGKELWVQSSLTPILDDAGNVKKWVIIDTDVTARKKAEDGIRQQNEKITDSINYAKSIQEALLPPLEEIQKHLPESFILYKPKDIVSGDFYWIYEDKGRVLIAVADCTGHGVPGAFMSLMGNNFLNDIIKVKGKYTPSEILDELNIQILNTLKQNSKDTSVKYGMDIALISLHATVEDRVNLQFAGAHSPLLIFRGDQCIPIKGNQRSIGSFQKNEDQGFSNQTLHLLKGDMLYMFSDGYADQIGGQENKKIFSQPFRDILQSISQLEMSEQKKILDTTITDWKGNLNQTDDILVIGIRI